MNMLLCGLDFVHGEYNFVIFKTGQRRDSAGCALLDPPRWYTYKSTRARPRGLIHSKSVKLHQMRWSVKKQWKTLVKAWFLAGGHLASYTK